MSALFKVEETVTPADWAAFGPCAVERKAGRTLGSFARTAPASIRKTGTLLGVMLIGIGALMLLVLVLLLFVQPELSPISPLILFMGGSFLFFGIRCLRRRNFSPLSAIPDAPGAFDAPMQLSFEQDAFFAFVDGRSSSFRYHSLSEVWEDEVRFYLLIAGNLQYILRKDSFTRGDPGGFSAFISRQTGKPVNYSG